MVARLLGGEKARAVASSMGWSPTTVTRTRDRWLAASEAGDGSVHRSSASTTAGARTSPPMDDRPSPTSSRCMSTTA